MAEPVDIIIRSLSPDLAKQESAPEKQTAENSGNGTKYKCTITSERFAQLKKIVDEALRDHKVFTIRGGWQVLRRALLRRNWVEKSVDPQTKSPKPSSALASPSCIEDLCIAFPQKQSWETPAAHTTKCERMIISRLLQLHEADFYWNTRKDSHDMQIRLNCNRIMSRFSRSLFTSKEGLCLLLQQMYWHNEPGVANVNFPRCYVLGFPDHFHNFVDDFRLTSCTSLLKYVVHMYETEEAFALQAPEGPEATVPFSALQFAMDRLNEFLATKKHMDIDVDIPIIQQLEWDTFLEHFNKIVHQKQHFLEDKLYILPVLVSTARTILKKVMFYWPQYNLDGMRNIWIMKPGNKCRGRGIQLVKEVKDVARIMDLKLKYVVQKYIERPLIIYKTKFDIRQWFMITSVQPLTIWMYRESYLRFSSQTFTLDSFHEALHLTNHAVQCKYKNTEDRDKNLPDDNMWDCYTFQAYLKSIGHANKWESVIYPGMKESIIGSMLSCQDTMDRRPNTFELYGADFILAEDFQPWLLEINSSPDLSSSTTVTARMCPQCLEDLIKVVIDKRRDPSCDTGLFDLIYKQNFPRPPAYLGMTLSVRGRRIFKRHKMKRDKENEGSKRVESISSKRRDLLRLVAPEQRISGNAHFADVTSDEIRYRGPVIADLIDEIHRSIESDQDQDGIELAQPVKSHTLTSMRKKSKSGPERGAKVSCALPNYRTKGTKRNSSPPPPIRESTTNANGNCRTPPTDPPPPTSSAKNNGSSGAIGEWRALVSSAANRFRASGDNKQRVEVAGDERTQRNGKANSLLLLNNSVDSKARGDDATKFNKEYNYVPSVYKFSCDSSKHSMLTVGRGYALRRLSRPNT